MDTLPLEVVERILSFCSGAQFSRCARVCLTWLRATQNVERTCNHFWRVKCEREIPSALVEELAPRQLPLEELAQDQCKQVYRKWFSCLKVKEWKHALKTSDQQFGSKGNLHESVSALALTGSLVVSGHLSGAVNLVDVNNDKEPLALTHHLAKVNDLALVNLVDQDRFRLNLVHEPKAFSNHHHVVSVGDDSRIFISLIGRSSDPKYQSIELCSRAVRHFQKVRVCRDRFAVSAKQTLQILLFLLPVPEDGVIDPETKLQPVLLTTISCKDFFASCHHWLGLFTFNDLQISVSNCLSREEDLILHMDLGSNVLKWKAVNEIMFESDADEDSSHELNLAAFTGFSFGHKIFFMLTYSGNTFFTTNGVSFKHCSIDDCLSKSDKVMSLSLFGSVFVCGTHRGYIYIYECCKLDKLKSLDRHKPLFTLRLCREPIVKTSFCHNGSQLVLAAATAHKVSLVTWTPDDHIDDHIEANVILIE